jgi:L-serine/L-threonine ammonia-lyase
MTNENDPALSSPCVAEEARSLNLFASTPLIYSIPLSKLCHPHPVFLKLDLLQPSGSFKDRGMAHLCSTVNNEHKQLHQKDIANAPKIKLVASSGGNAGLGVATVARSLPTMEISVVVPETTKPLVIDKLRLLGAEVTVYGANWNIADALARQRVNEIKEMGGHAVYVRYALSTLSTTCSPAILKY